MPFDDDPAAEADHGSEFMPKPDPQALLRREVRREFIERPTYRGGGGSAATSEKADLRTSKLETRENTLTQRPGNRLGRFSFALEATWQP
jgi:hypothetical protein